MNGKINIFFLFVRIFIVLLIIGLILPNLINNLLNTLELKDMTDMPKGNSKLVLSHNLYNKNILYYLKKMIYFYFGI